MSKGDMTAAEYRKKVGDLLAPGKAKKPRRQDEFIMQRDIFSIDLPKLEAVYPIIRFVYSNQGGARVSSGTARKLKASGMRSGIPDIGLDAARRGYKGFRVELKVSGGAVSLTQKEWHKHLEAEGYLIRVCRSRNEFLDLLIWYLTESSDEEK